MTNAQWKYLLTGTASTTRTIDLGQIAPDSLPYSAIMRAFSVNRINRSLLSHFHGVALPSRSSCLCPRSPTSILRLILAASSPLFETMLYLPGHSPATVDTPLAIAIKGVEPDIFRQLLRCIYTDRVDVNDRNLRDLVKVAKKYQIHKLKLACSEYMERGLCTETACSIFNMGPSVLEDEEFGLEYVEENMESLVNTPAFLELDRDRLKYLLRDDKLAIDEVPLFLAVKKWGLRECERMNIKSDPAGLRISLKVLT